MSQSTSPFVEDGDAAFQYLPSFLHFDGSPSMSLNDVLTKIDWETLYANSVASLATTGMTPQPQAPHHGSYAALTPPYDSPSPLVCADPPTASSPCPDMSARSYSSVPFQSQEVYTPFQTRHAPITPPWSEASLSPDAHSSQPPAVGEEFTNLEYFSNLFTAPVAPAPDPSGVEYDPSIFEQVQWTLANHHPEYQLDAASEQAQTLSCFSAEGSTGAVYGQPYSLNETNGAVSVITSGNHTAQTTLSDGNSTYGARELQYALAPPDNYYFYDDYPQIQYNPGQNALQVPTSQVTTYEPFWYYQSLPSGSVSYTQQASSSRVSKTQQSSSKAGSAPAKKKAPRPKAVRTPKATLLSHGPKPPPQARSDRAKADHIACVLCRKAKQRCERGRKDQQCKRCESKGDICDTPDDAKPRGHPRKDGSKPKAVVTYDQTIVIGDDSVRGQECC